MTDEQIIKAWEKILSAGDAPIGKHWLCGSVTTEFAKATLDMLNRQNAEIERLTKRQKPTVASGYKVENGKIVFFTTMLGGCRNEYENLDEVAKTLNELLQEAYAKDEIAFHLRCAKEDLKSARAEAINAYFDEVKKRCIESGIYPVIVKNIMEDVRKEMT